MQPEKEPKGLRNFRYYIVKALKFFDMKDEYLTPIIFCIILFASFFGTFMSEDTFITNPSSIIYTVISIVIMYMASTVYLAAYIKENREQEYSLGSCLKEVLTKTHKILIASIIYILAIAMGSLLLLIPGFMFYVMFMFVSCFILDENETVIASFSSSKRITDGKKMNIFSIILLFNFLLFLPTFIAFMAAMSSGNGLIFNFVVSFASSIVNLMQQRLIALMYIDLRYGIKSL